MEFSFGRSFPVCGQKGQETDRPRKGLQSFSPQAPMTALLPWHAQHTAYTPPPLPREWKNSKRHPPLVPLPTNTPCPHQSSPAGGLLGPAAQEFSWFPGTEVGLPDVVGHVPCWESAAFAAARQPPCSSEDSGMLGRREQAESQAASPDVLRSAATAAI